jgi:hypothetical protein
MLPQISYQAIIVLIVYFLVLLVSFIGTVKKVKFTFRVFVSLLVSLFIIVLLVYDTNCLTEGTCNIWSWVRTIIYCIFPVIALIFLFIAFFSKEEPKYTTPDITTPNMSTQMIPMPHMMPSLTTTETR